MLHIIADSVFEATRTSAFRYGRMPDDWRITSATAAQERRTLPRRMKKWLGLT